MENKTKLYGLKFEQATNLNTALSETGYIIDSRIKVFKGDDFIGYSVRKNKFYKDFLEVHGIHYEKYNSKKWQPDEAFVNEKTRTVFIIEKKFQNKPGFIDEKLPNCDFKKKEYEKLVIPLGYKVEFIYVFNDWFKQDTYKDTLEYITSVGCHYVFNEIPLKLLNL